MTYEDMWLPSLSARRAWIEIGGMRTAHCDWIPSLSARRAWIEMLLLVPELLPLCVALRKESVDRNNDLSTWNQAKTVALRKESVDRNLRVDTCMYTEKRSLSARRAWIEIWVVQRRRRPPSSRSPQGERG